MNAAEQRITDAFHDLYYGNRRRTWGSTYFLGIQTYKLPLDLWVYQEIIHAIRPDVIVETGSYKGGSALYLATICDAVGNGLVITVDIEGRIHPRASGHPRIRSLQGSSVDPEIVSRVRSMIPRRSTVLAMLDSDHSKEHVLKELETYGRLVTTGSYLIVEDTNVNGHPVYPEFGPGPMEAVRTFLRKNRSFRRDRSMEKFYVTFNPQGFLLKTGR